MLARVPERAPESATCDGGMVRPHLNARNEGPNGRLTLHVRVAFLIAGLCVGCADPTTPPTPGQVFWRVPTSPPTDPLQLPLSPVANADRSMVYFATDDNRLRKIRGSDGHVVWEVPAGAIAPVVPGMNAVLSASVVALAKVDIVAFDTATGAPRWLYQPADLEETGDDPLAANDSTIFAAGLPRARARPNQP